MTRKRRPNDIVTAVRHSVVTSQLARVPVPTLPLNVEIQFAMNNDLADFLAVRADEYGGITIRAVGPEAAPLMIRPLAGNQIRVTKGGAR